MPFTPLYNRISDKLCGIWITHSGQADEMAAANAELTRIKHDLQAMGYEVADRMGEGWIADGDGEHVLRAFDETNLTLVMQARNFTFDQARLRADMEQALHGVEIS
jgi:hypothetical protein